MNSPNFFAELKRRNLYKVAAVTNDKNPPFRGVRDRQVSDRPVTAGNVATPLLRQLQLPQQRLVAGIALEVLDARVRFYEGQPAIALAVCAVQPGKCPIKLVAAGIDGGDVPGPAVRVIGLECGKCPIGIALPSQCAEGQSKTILAESFIRFLLHR